jgi:membrane-bound ClpP family serine protease
MSLTVIAVLIIVGLLFLIIEILVVPGTTVVGIVGFVLIAIGVWQTYAAYGTATGHWVLAATLVLTIATLALSLRGNTWKKLMLKSNVDGKTNVIEENAVKIGDEGIAISRLAPMGKALINNQYFEVSSTGDFIDEQSKIIVTKIEFNKIYIKKKKEI